MARGRARSWRSSPSPRSCGCRASTSAAPGTPTRAPTCSCSARSSATARSRSSARRRRSATFHHGALYYYLLAPAAFLTGVGPARGRRARSRCSGSARSPRRGGSRGSSAARSPASSRAARWPCRRPAIEARRSSGTRTPSRSRRRSRSLAGACTPWTAGTPRWWLLAAVGRWSSMQRHVAGRPRARRSCSLAGPRRRAAAATGERRRACSGGPRRPRDRRGWLPAAPRPRAPERVHRHARDHRLPPRRRRRRRGRGARRASHRRPPVARVARSRASSRSAARSASPSVVIVVLLLARGGGGGDPGAARGRWLSGLLAWSILALALFAPSLAVDHPGPPERPLPLVPRPARAGARRCRAGVRRGAGGRRGGGGAILSDRVLRHGGVLRDGAPRPRGGPRDRAGRDLRQCLAPGDRRPTAAGRSSPRPPIARPRPWAPATAPSRSSGSRRSRTPTRCASRSSTSGSRSRTMPDAASASNIVIVCDPLFDDVVGAACGGPAEDVLDRRQRAGRHARRPLRGRRPSCALGLHAGAVAGICVRVLRGSDSGSTSRRNDVHMRSRHQRAPRSARSAPNQPVRAQGSCPLTLLRIRARPGSSSRTNERLKCERRPLQTGVRCPRDPSVEGRPGRALEKCYGRPGVRVGGRIGGRWAP